MNTDLCNITKLFLFFFVQNEQRDRGTTSLFKIDAVFKNYTTFRYWFMETQISTHTHTLWPPLQLLLFLLKVHPFWLVTVSVKQMRGFVATVMKTSISQLSPRHFSLLWCEQKELRLLLLSFPHTNFLREALCPPQHYFTLRDPAPRFVGSFNELGLCGGWGYLYWNQGHVSHTSDGIT